MIRVFMEQMEKKKILSYPAVLVNVSDLLIQNDFLFNNFIHILFKKTNIHDFLTYQKTIEIVNGWF